MKPTRIFLLIGIIIVFSIKSSGQSGIPSDSLLHLIKSKGIHSRNANWPKTEQLLYKELIAAKSDMDTIQGFLKLLESLGDVHTQIIYKGNNYANYPSFSESELARLSPLVQRSDSETGNFKLELIEYKYLYLLIPGIQAWGAQTNEIAQQISDKICGMDLSAILGFIVDLRLNGGGQMSTMISGINLLLGNNYLGGGVNSLGQETQKLEIKNSNLHINGIPQTMIKNKCISELTDPPVVILTGPVTRSSGSIVAISFKNRPNTYFIGEPTADGYSTGNEFFYINSNLSLHLSTTFNMDRKGIVYKSGVPTDLLIKDGDNFDSIKNDKKVGAALQWFVSRRK